MKDSLSEMKCLTSPLQKSLAHVENDLVLSILEDVKSLELQLESLEDAVKDLKEENGSIMGTLQVQDKDLTILDSHLAKLEALLKQQVESGDEVGTHVQRKSAVMENVDECKEDASSAMTKAKTEHDNNLNVCC
jgi:hypothetical protein